MVRPLCCPKGVAKSEILSSIPLEVIDKPLKENQLAKISKKLLEWQVKGSLFGLSEGEMEDIKEDYKHSNEMQKVAMLRMWAKKHGDQATLRFLIETSYESDCEVFAKKAVESLGYLHSDKGKIPLS